MGNFDDAVAAMIKELAERALAAEQQETNQRLLHDGRKPLELLPTDNDHEDDGA